MFGMLDADDPRVVATMEQVERDLWIKTDIGGIARYADDYSAPGYLMAGHVHPAYVLSTRVDSLRLPCFVAGATRMILPSFGAFTGGHVITPEPGEKVFVSAGDAVHCVR
jgi:hypothetical protein